MVLSVRIVYCILFKTKDSIIYIPPTVSFAKGRYKASGGGGFNHKKLA